MSSPTGRSADENRWLAAAVARRDGPGRDAPAHRNAARPTAHRDATVCRNAADATALAETRPHARTAGATLAGKRRSDRPKVRAYRIVAELGRGGMGVVYEAVHDEIGQRAAVKTLNLQRLASSASDPAIAQRFLTEAKALAIAVIPGWSTSSTTASSPTARCSC